MTDPIVEAPPLPEWLAKSLHYPTLTGAAPLPAEVKCHFDGLCEPFNPGGVTTLAWAVLHPDGTTLREFHAVLAHGGERATNNWGEWAAFGTLLRYVTDDPAVRKVWVSGDSLLVVNQFNGDWAARAPHLIELRDRAREIAAAFRARGGELTVRHVVRAENTAADALSEKAFFAYAEATNRPALVAQFRKEQARRATLKAAKAPRPNPPR